MILPASMPYAAADGPLNGNDNVCEPEDIACHLGTPLPSEECIADEGDGEAIGNLCHQAVNAANDCANDAGGSPCHPAHACANGEPNLPCNPNPVIQPGTLGACVESCETHKISILDAASVGVDLPDAYLVRCIYTVFNGGDPDDEIPIPVPGLEINTDEICLLGVYESTVATVLDRNTPKPDLDVPIIEVEVGLCSVDTYVEVYGFDVVDGATVPCVNVV